MSSSESSITSDITTNIIENIDGCVDKLFENSIKEQNILNLKKYIKFTTSLSYVDTTTGKNALHILAKYSSFSTDVNESNELIKWLVLEQHFDINICDGGCWTPLTLASRLTNKSSSVSTVHTLLNLGANPNICMNKGKPPLVLAINETGRDSCDEVVNLLLDFGADIEFVSLNMTPLMYACRDSHMKCKIDDISHCCSSLTTVELLLKRGANPNVIINDFSPLFLTYRFIERGNSHKDTLKMLIKYGAKKYLKIGSKSFTDIIPIELDNELIEELLDSDEYVDDKSENECVICLGDNPNVKFSPCGHVCVCPTCYHMTKECYTCFKFVEQYHKLKLRLT
jgi:ankyrin repeat protein